MEAIELEGEVTDRDVREELGLPVLLPTREKIDIKRENELKNIERMMREVPR